MPWQLTGIWKPTCFLHLHLTNTGEKTIFCSQHSAALTPLPSSLSRTDKRLLLATVSFGRYLLKTFCTLMRIYATQHCHQISQSSCWLPRRNQVCWMNRSPGWQDLPYHTRFILLFGRQRILITMNNLESGHYFSIEVSLNIKKWSLQ